MSELLFREETYRVIGLCMEVHRELGRGHDEVICKDALTVELKHAGIPFSREKHFQIEYKGEWLPHRYFADFVIYDGILFEGKACQKLAEAHLKQTLNYLAASKLKLGLLVNFGEDSLQWRRVVRDPQHQGPAPGFSL